MTYLDHQLIENQLDIELADLRQVIQASDRKIANSL